MLDIEVASHSADQDEKVIPIRRYTTPVLVLTTQQHTALFAYSTFLLSIDS